MVKKKIILPTEEEARNKIDLDIKKSGYFSPLSSRYSTNVAKHIVSEEFRWTQVRRIWLAVLKVQKKLNLVSGIKTKDIKKLEKQISDFDWDRISKIESETKHDVKAQIQYLGEMIPGLKGKIHVSMTSEDAVSNAETMMNKYWIEHTLAKLYTLLQVFEVTMLNNKSIPALGETHLQPASAITVGKRVAMWAGPLLEDFLALKELSKKYDTIKGIRGPTGTYDGLIELSGGNKKIVKQFEKELKKELGVKITKLVPGQTAPRSWDNELVFRFASISANLAKIATDIRHLARVGEMGEPRSKGQDGSSAMPHKRNPMKMERLNSLSRLTIGYMTDALMTQHTQGLERTLDDSAGRRMYMPESFLVVDASLRLMVEVFSGLDVNKLVSQKRLEEQLPFIAGEKILMRAVDNGIDREDAHKFFKDNAMEVYEGMVKGKITVDKLFKKLKKKNSPFKDLELPDLSNHFKFVGDSVQLCEDFSKHLKKKVFDKYDYRSENVKTSV